MRFRSRCEQFYSVCLRFKGMRCMFYSPRCPRKDCYLLVISISIKTYICIIVIFKFRSSFSYFHAYSSLKCTLFYVSKFLIPFHQKTLIRSCSRKYFLRKASHRKKKTIAVINFMVTPCINDIKHVIVHLMHTTLKSYLISNLFNVSNNWYSSSPLIYIFHIYRFIAVILCSHNTDIVCTTSMYPL